MAIRNIPEVPGYLAPTLGSTSIGSGSTVETISDLTLSNTVLNSPYILGGIRDTGGGRGTSGQVIQSTGTGWQWANSSSYSAPTLGSTSIPSGSTVYTIDDLALGGAILSSPYILGGIRDTGGNTGTSGQVIQSTGSGWQWATASSPTAPFSASSMPNFYGIWQNPNDSSYAYAVSDNGTNWSQIPTGYAFTSVAYGFGRFFAVDSVYGDLFRSIDGYNWEFVTTFTSTVSNLYFVNNVMFAVDSVNETSTIFHSSDGITWSARTTPGNPTSGRWFKPSFGNGTYFSARWNRNQAARSTDGLTWVTTSLPNTRNWNESAFGNGRFVVAGSNRVAYSTDAINWTEVSLPSIGSGVGHSVEFINGQFVVAGTNTNSIAVSADGITWEIVSKNGYYSKILFASGFSYDASDDSSTLYYSSHPSLYSWNQSANPLSTYKPMSIAAASQYSEISPVITTTTLNASITRYSHIIINTSSTHTITLPSANAYNRGKELHIKQIGSATVVSASSNVRPIGSNTAGTAILSGAGKFARLVSDGFSWTIMDSN
jgi:hypothetical protein